MSQLKPPPPPAPRRCNKHLYFRVVLERLLRLLALFATHAALPLIERQVPQIPQFSSGVTENRPMKVRVWDVDSDMRCYSLRRHEQRLDRTQTTTSNRTGTTGMAVAAHRAGDRGATGNGERLRS